MLCLATGDVADHVERFLAVYQHALHDPADDGVYEALGRHFTDYGLAFIARSTHPDLPDANHQVIAQFVAHGFAGAIRAWRSDDPVTKTDLLLQRPGRLHAELPQLPSSQIVDSSPVFPHLRSGDCRNA